MHNLKRADVTKLSPITPFSRRHAAISRCGGKIRLLYFFIEKSNFSPFFAQILPVLDADPLQKNCFRYGFTNGSSLSQCQRKKVCFKPATGNNHRCRTICLTQTADRERYRKIPVSALIGYFRRVIGELDR